MLAFSKMLVLLLLGAAITVPLAGQVLWPDAASYQRTAGCHKDGGNLPAPEPTSHACCLGVHYPAILQQNSVSRPLLQVSAEVESSLDAEAVAAFDPFPSFVFASGGPPLISPLRV
jgi:hypothetical protein